MLLLALIGRLVQVQLGPGMKTWRNKHGCDLNVSGSFLERTIKPRYAATACSVAVQVACKLMTVVSGCAQGLVALQQTSHWAQSTAQQLYSMCVI